MNLPLTPPLEPPSFPPEHHYHHPYPYLASPPEVFVTS
ncbi:hypothetical protein BJF96_g8335 [Verticillium dahliae]|uniref:Uncharacterized protein n=1 Tax=Verticillium dahliae TaxID=27337 RepID=A0AA44WF36_VERDA|nr:hypothetical protein BJF96_g8335 [Verticillium dahliae]PNH43453.1 hypothetical protein VD0003_g9613 [Verticillium dahliae]